MQICDINNNHFSRMKRKTCNDMEAQKGFKRCKNFQSMYDNTPVQKRYLTIHGKKVAKHLKNQFPNAIVYNTRPLVVLIPNIVLIGILIFTYCRIKTHKSDGYGLKSEFKVVGLTLIVGCFLQIIFLILKINSSVASFWVVLIINPALFGSMTI